jgi:predicted ribosomally synthesized peptide with SipW-like signal peptide
MKKILLSLGVIAIVAVGAIGATRAYFSDTATVSGSTITAGTLDLKVDSNLSGGTQEWSDGFSSPVTFANLAPGFSQSQTVDIQKQGSVDGQASIRFHLTANKDKTVSGDWSGSLAQNMRVKVSYAPNNTDFGGVLYDYTLAEFHANTNQLLLGAITGSDKIASVKLEWYIPTSAGNDIQGDSLTVDTIFGLAQNQ